MRCSIFPLNKQLRRTEAKETVSGKDNATGLAIK